MQDYTSVKESIDAIARFFGISFSQVPAELWLQRDKTYFLKISSGINITHYPVRKGTTREVWYLNVVIPVPILEAAIELRDHLVSYCDFNEIQLSKVAICHEGEDKGEPYLVSIIIREDELVGCEIKGHFIFNMTYYFRGEHHDT